MKILLGNESGSDGMIERPMFSEMLDRHGAFGVTRIIKFPINRAIILHAAMGDEELQDGGIGGGEPVPSA